MTKAVGEPFRYVVTWGRNVVIKPEMGGGIYWTKVSVDIFASCRRDERMIIAGAGCIGAVKGRETDTKG